MKGKFITHLKNRWQEYGSFLLMLMIIFAMLYHLMDLKQLDINIPMSYYGGDDMGVLVNAKQFTEQGWNMTSDRLGAPYTVQYYDFTSSMMHNAGLFIMKIFAVITGNAGSSNESHLSVNILYGRNYIILCHEQY